MNIAKYTASAATLALALMLALPVQAEVTITEKTEHSVFKGVFLTVWARLKAIQPRQRQLARSATVATAGIRGAETTESLLQPYWKNDLSQDPAFQRQIEQFAGAQALMDSGELERAADAFGQFIEHFSSSDLVPSARFSRGVCQAALGDTAAATASIRTFIDNNPGHAMIDDARLVLAQIRGD